MTVEFTLEQLKDFLEEFVGVTFDASKEEQLTYLLATLNEQGKLITKGE